MSPFRLASSYASAAAVIAATGWLSFNAFPLMGQPQYRERQFLRPAVALTPAPDPQPQRRVLPGERVGPPTGAKPADVAVSPVPSDGREPVTGGVQIASTPDARAAALNWIERARQSNDWHMRGTPPFRMDIAFTASGIGPGQMTETWFSGQSWRWTAHLGDYSQTQVGSNGVAYGDRQGLPPMRVHMLRTAVFAPAQLNPNFQIRTAAIQGGTCVLMSGVRDERSSSPTRLWEEVEYCFDNGSSAMTVYSIAPGSYTVYGYTRKQQFHGRLVPDTIVMYEHGAEVLNGQITITDADPSEASAIAPTQEMIAHGPALKMTGVERFPMTVTSAVAGTAIQSVIVRAEIGPDGQILEAEPVTTADAASEHAAIDAVRNGSFGANGSLRQVVVNVKLVTQSQ